MAKNSWSLMVSWGLSTAANSVSLCVSMMYWVVIYTPSTTFHPPSAMGNFINIDTHVLHAAISIADVIVSSRPWRLSHVYIPLLFTFLYLGFHLTYLYGFNGKNEDGEDYIYEAIDWKNETGIAVAYVFAMLVCLILSHAFFVL